MKRYTVHILATGSRPGVHLTMLRESAIAAAMAAAMEETEYRRFLGISHPAATAHAVADDDPADTAVWPIPR